MNDGWRQTTWGKLASLEYGKALREHERRPGDYPIFGTNGPIGHHDDFLCPYPGVIVGRKGAYRGIHYSDRPFWVIDTAFYLEPQADRVVDLKWAYYQLRTIDLNRIDSGSAIPSTSRDAFYQIPVSLPPIDVQTAVARFLTAFDDLIANNKRRIEILEEMARAIYRHWFVEFKYPGHEDVPLVESELGPIPQGWRVVSVGEVLDFNIGGGWGKEDEDEAHQVPAYVIRGTDMPRVSLMDFTSVPLRYHKESNYRSRRLDPGDIVMEVSGGGKDQSVGRTIFVTRRLVDELQGQVICASFCKLLRTDSSLDSLIFYRHLDEMYRQGRLDEFQVQSTGIKNFRFKPFLQHHKVVVPERNVQEQFVSIVDPIVAFINTLGIQSSRLAETRDLLLPKLISGEIDVSELDIGDAA